METEMIEIPMIMMEDSLVEAHSLNDINEGELWVSHVVYAAIMLPGC